MPTLDVAKLVGAASAPVALIIASSIFLSNLGAKYALFAGAFRDLSRELRHAEDKGSLRAKSIKEQLKLYSFRLRILMRATFWLSLAILCFMFTVALTGVSVLLPQSHLWPLLTAAFSFLGMLILAGSIVLEMVENHQAQRAMILETSEFPDTLPERMEKDREYVRPQAA
jgi:hypothetical protein